MNPSPEAALYVATRRSNGRETRPSQLVQRRVHGIGRQIEAMLGTHLRARLAPVREVFPEAETERLARALVVGASSEVDAAVRQLLQDGVSPQRICLDLLTPLARLLGVWWEEDRCGFVEVTLGLLALQRVLRDLAPGLGGVAALDPRRSALMVPLPGEQHSFGIGMVAEFFRGAGWQVAQGAVSDRHALGRRVASEWFGIVALSCGTEERLGDLPAAIATVRARSFNPHVAIMVGGAALLGNDAATLAPEADVTARDAAEALRRAEALIGSMAALP
jgi:methanogenic corrinoid protein MtbC1